MWQQTNKLQVTTTTITAIEEVGEQKKKKNKGMQQSAITHYWPAVATIATAASCRYCNCGNYDDSGGQQPFVQRKLYHRYNVQRACMTAYAHVYK